MAKRHILTACAVALQVAACASPPTAIGISANGPQPADCRRVAPTGSKIKSKTVCGPPRRGASVLTRKQFETERDPRDVFGTGRVNAEW